jgi:hypothetical protein
MNYVADDNSYSPEKHEYKFRLKDINPNSESGISGTDGHLKNSNSSSFRTVYANR